MKLASALYSSLFIFFFVGLTYATMSHASQINNTDLLDSLLRDVSSKKRSHNTKYNSSNRLFHPITANRVPTLFTPIDHPFPPVYADLTFAKQTTVPTSSWISNLFYPSINSLAPVTPDPYILRVLDGEGSWGLSISQPAKPVIGSYPAMNNIPATSAGYAVHSAVTDLRLSAKEWTKKPVQSVVQWDLMSAQLKLTGNNSAVTFPIVRGNAFVTANYQKATPEIYTQRAIMSFGVNGMMNGTAVTGTRFNIALNDGSNWLLYALGDALTFKLSSTNVLVASGPYEGVVQLAKLPRAEDEEVLDAHAGVWATGGKVTIDEKGTSYRIDWLKEGDTSKKLLTYAYPHHLKTLTTATVRTNLTLNSSSKGAMKAVVGDTWTLNEPDLPTIDWLPAQPVPDTTTRNEILQTLADEIRTTNYSDHTIALDDTYFAGKGLQKLAMLALILNKPQTTGLVNPELAELALTKLKTVMAPFLDNKVPGASFQYDRTYRGIVATAGLPKSMGGSGDRDAMFGHSYYNDHHYHQGYFIVTAAVVRLLDPAWRSAELTEWTEALIRDVNNPVQDEWFAQFRSWDWFAGHSWAGGIKVEGALDGRDQESVPEAANFYWGCKLWGLATENDALVNLVNLQLALIKRTTYEYFWLLDSNQNRPPEMIKNKVVGIYFEQKLDYTTYFGRYLEFIHGIQQLPMTPILADYIRTPEFVKQEWEQRLKTVAPTLKSGWKGILYMNYAMIDPAMAYPVLRTTELDDGQTRSYSLYLAATRPSFYRRSLSKLLKDKLSRHNNNNMPNTNNNVVTTNTTNYLL